MPTSPGVDLYSPFMAATIVDPQGNQYPLWTNVTDQGTPTTGGQASFQNSGVTSLPFVTSISVEYQLAYRPVITLVFTPPYSDAIALLDSSMIQWGQSTLQVQFGYSGGAPSGPLLTPIFEGILMKPDISLGETIEITFHAEGTGGASATRQAGNQVFNNVSLQTVIQGLAAGPGGPGNPQRNFTIDFSQARQDPAIASALDATIDNYTQGNETDYFCIWNLLFEIGCWMYFSGNTLVVTSRNSSMTAPPKFTLSFFDMGGFSLDDGSTSPPGLMDPGQGQYPIYTASSPQMALYMAGAVQQIVLQDISDSQGTPNQNISNQANVSPAATGPGGTSGKSTNPATALTPGTNSNTLGGGEFAFGNPERAAAIRSANAKFVNATSLMGIPLNVTCPGIPTIIPGDTVKIKGLGGRLEANYAVFKVVHTLGTDGFSTELDLVGNLSANSQGDTPDGQVNTQDQTDQSGPTATATNLG